MSYCTLILFRDGTASTEIRYNNSWHGGPMIWNQLCSTYSKPASSWLTNAESINQLEHDPRLTRVERAMLLLTFDGAVVARANWPQLIADLREFATRLPEHNHLVKWARALEARLDEGWSHVGWLHTDVCQNRWRQYREDQEEPTPVTLAPDNHFEIYDDLLALATPAEQSQPAEFVDSPERAQQDAALTRLHYVPDQFRQYFTSPFEQYADRIGQPFTVLGHAVEDEQAAVADGNAFEDMYRIEFADGVQITAWGHEVCQLDYERCS